MANQRGTFAKRQRETELKDKARAKEERRAAKRAEVRPSKGPEIAWDQPGGEGSIDSPPTPAAPTTPVPAAATSDDSSD